MCIKITQKMKQHFNGKIVIKCSIFMCFTISQNMKHYLCSYIFELQGLEKNI